MKKGKVDVDKKWLLLAEQKQYRVNKMLHLFVGHLLVLVILTSNQLIQADEHDHTVSNPRRFPELKLTSQSLSLYSYVNSDRLVDQFNNK